MNEVTKKSAVDLTALALGVVVLGIVVTVGAVILTNMRDNQVTNLDVTTVVNETLTTVTGTGEALSTGWVKGLVTVTNASGGQVIPATNYTLTVDPVSGAGRIVSTGSHPYNNTNFNVTYQVYDKTDVRYALTDNATQGLSEFGNWFDILVIVGIAAVILALIFMAFGKSSAEGSGVGY